jgi:putative transposase
MSLPRSKYYHKPKKDNLADFVILNKITGIALDFPSYGYRRITAHLRREGIIINHKRVYRVMATNGICCSIRRAYKHTTNSNHGLAKYQNLVKNLTPVRTDQVWHADITYIRFEASFAYLAAIIALAERQ